MARGKKVAQGLTPEEKLAQALVPMEEQPYQIPENWCWVRLLNVANLYNGDRGKNYPSKKDYQITGIPFINAGALVDGQLEPKEFNYISEEKYNALSAGKIQCGDILYCLRGSLGKSAIVEIEGNGAISSSLCILRCTKAIDNRFLFFLLNSDIIKKQQDSAENGSAQPNLSAASVIKYMVPLPSIFEQKRIVDRIESIFAKLDEAKEKAQVVVDGFELRKSAILHKAFMGELTAKWRKLHGLDLKNWEYLKIGEFAQVKGGKRLPKGCSLVTQKTDHPYLRIADFGNNTIDKTDLHYITEDVFEQIRSYIIKKEDVYLSIVGTIGRAGVIPEELDGANLTENAARIITNRTQPRYLCLFLSSPQTQENIKSRIRSATLGKLSILNIKDIDTPLPTVEEQLEIVRIINDLFEKESAAKEAAESVLDQIDTMKKAVLARAFRGELGTNDPTEESAIELLKSML